MSTILGITKFEIKMFEILVNFCYHYTIILIDIIIFPTVSYSKLD